MSSGRTQSVVDTRTSNSETCDDTDASPAPGTVQTVRGHRAATAPPVARDEESRALARYHIVDEHGRGGLGRVVRALDRELGRTVAIKELLRHGRVAEARFLREALITARLEHPNIVPVHEAGRWPDGTPYYSMKLVAGRQLRELIEEAETLEQRLALIPHVVDVADAIAYAHARRIVHRDLKPANVIVGEYGETVVIDWGLAKDLSAHEYDDAGDPYRAPQPPGDITVAGTVMGTPAYMSPEQARGEPGDELSDVYALGAMLYSVLTGRVPYQASSSAEAVRAVIEGPPRSVPAIAPGVAADLVAIVTAAMHRDRDARLASARAFGDELRRYLDGHRVRSHRYTPAERALLWIRRHRELSVSVGVALAVLLGLGAAAISRIVDERDVADRQRHRAEAALTAASDQRDRLVLRNARVGNDHDPTAALATVATYQGKDSEKAQELAAIAIGRNAAIFARAADPRLFSVAAVSFSPPLVIGTGLDRVVRSWTPGAEKARTLATDIAPALVATPDEAEGVAYADGAQVYSIGADGIRYLRMTLSAPAATVLFTDNGRWLAAVATNGDLRILGAGGERALTLPPEARDIALVTLSEGAETFGVCSTNGQLWSHRGDRWSRAGSCSQEHGSLLAISDDGRWLATLFGQRLVLHDLERPSATRSLALAGAPTGINVLANGTVVTADRTGAVHVVDPATMTARRILTGSSAVVHLCERPGGDIAVGFANGDIQVVSPVSGHIETLSGFRSSVVRLQWSSDGRRLLAADADGFRIWTLAHLDVHDTGSTANQAAAYSADGQRLAAGTQGGNLVIVDRGARSLQVLRGSRSSTTSAAFRGDALVSGALDGQVRLWNLTDGSSRSVLDGRNSIVAVVVSPRQRTFTLDTDGHVLELGLDGTARSLTTIRGRTYAMTLSADGATLTVHEERALHTIDVDTAATRTLSTHAAPGYGFAASPDGRWFVRGTIDGIIEVLTSSGAILHSGFYGGRCSRAAIASSGEVAVACGTVLVTLRQTQGRWSARTRTLEHPPLSLAYSPDGHSLAMGTPVGLVYVLDRRTDALAATQAITGSITSLTFAADGTELTATTGSPEIHRIHVPALEPVPNTGIGTWIAQRSDIATPNLDGP